MNSILSLVKELQNDSGKLGKKNILEREINNDEFKQFIKYVLDPMYIYGLQAKKLKKFLGKTSGTSPFNNLFEVFEYLLKNNTGKDKDAEAIATFIDNASNGNNELKELYVQSITKTLRMGIDKTVNKAWGKGFLNEFNLMLAKDFYKEMHKIKGSRFWLTEKIDGQRAAFIVDNGEVKVFSRQGKVITGLVELELEFSHMADGVYDGELLIKNEELYKDRAVLQETLKLSRKDGDKTGLNFHMFDYLTLDEFDKSESDFGYKARRVLMDGMIESYKETRGELKHIKLLPVLYEGTDLEVVPEFLAKLEDKGLEGLMLNTDTKYSCKRSGNILKIKSMKSFDDYCSGVFEGEGKYKGMLGGINMMYKGEYPLKIGSGFNDEQRKLYWNNPELIINKIVEVQYFRESQNEQGGLSVSFPVFKGIRDDKDEISYH